MPEVEFSRLVALKSAGERQELRIAAREEERRALCLRLDLAALDALSLEGFVERAEDALVASDASAWRFEGRLRADLAQRCVATGGPAPARVDVALERLFVLGAPADEAALEVDVDPLADEPDYLERPEVDFGETAAEALALELDPLPRSDAPEVRLDVPPPPRERGSGPFAALAELRAASGESDPS